MRRAFGSDRRRPPAFPRQALATALTAALIGSSLAGCGGEAWPNARGLADPTFLGRERAVETVDLLPVDLQVWTMPGYPRDPFALADEVDPLVSETAAAELARHGYRVVAQIDRSGHYVRRDGLLRTAMPADDVTRTTYSLSGYGLAQIEAPGVLLVPLLPARLGGETGSDATLYIGGWAFAGDDRRPARAGKVIGAILIVGLAVVLVAAALAGSKGSKGPRHGFGKVAAGAGRTAAGAGRVAGRAVAGLARTTIGVTHAVLRDPDLFYATTDSIGELAAAGTQVELQADRPDYYAEGPHDGRSAMLFEMTLIDNRTGRTLWHARQQFPASPVLPKDVARAVKRLMAALPAR